MSSFDQHTIADATATREEITPETAHSTKLSSTDKNKEKKGFFSSSGQAFANYFKNFFRYNESGRYVRIWELDVWRGVLMLFVTLIHVLLYIGPANGMFEYSTEFGRLINDVAVKFSGSAFANGVQPFGLYMFCFLSGLSCAFTRNHGKRALKMTIVYLLFMLFLMMATTILFDYTGPVFNILSVLAFCLIAWWLLELCKAPNWLRLLIAFVVIAIGFTYFYGWRVMGKNDMVNNPVWSIFVYNEYVIRERISYYDFQPLFPHLGFFLIAGVLSKYLYKDKKTLTTRLFPPKYIVPLAWVGKHSLLVYITFFPVLVGIVWLLAIII